MAELGESGNPRDLIPGDPDAVERNVTAIRGRGKSMEIAGDDLKKIDSGAWEGAAGDAFRDKFTYEPARWHRAADAFEATAVVQVAPFSDPGEAKRQAAREKLKRARQQLIEAGDRAAGTVRDRGDEAPSRPHGMTSGTSSPALETSSVTSPSARGTPSAALRNSSGTSARIT